MVDDIDKDEYLDHKRLMERRKFSMADVSGRNEDIQFEVNWNDHARKNGFIKIIVGDKEAVVSREHLYAILFMFGSAKEQEKMVSPFVKQTNVAKFYKLIGVTVSQDIKKGDMLNVPLEFTFNSEKNEFVIGQGSMSKLLS